MTNEKIGKIEFGPFGPVPEGLKGLRMPEAFQDGSHRDTALECASSPNGKHCKHVKRGNTPQSLFHEPEIVCCHCGKDVRGEGHGPYMP